MSTANISRTKSHKPHPRTNLRAQITPMKQRPSIFTSMIRIREISSLCLSWTSLLSPQGKSSRSILIPTILKTYLDSKAQPVRVRREMLSVVFLLKTDTKLKASANQRKRLLWIISPRQSMRRSLSKIWMTSISNQWGSTRRSRLTIFWCNRQTSKKEDLALNWKILNRRKCILAILHTRRSMP